MERGPYRPCPCGSGQVSWWELDGHGIELFRCCEQCRQEKLALYRPDIVSAYEADEPIDPQ